MEVGEINRGGCAVSKIDTILHGFDLIEERTNRGRERFLAIPGENFGVKNIVEGGKEPSLPLRLRRAGEQPWRGR